MDAKKVEPFKVGSKLEEKLQIILMDTFENDWKDAIAYFEKFINIKYDNPFNAKYGRDLNNKELLALPHQEEDPSDNNDTWSVADLFCIEAFFYKLDFVRNAPDPAKSLNDAMRKYCWNDATKIIDYDQDCDEVQNAKKKIVDARAKDYQFNSLEPDFNRDRSFYVSVQEKYIGDYLRYKDWRHFGNGENKKEDGSWDENHEIREEELKNCWPDKALHFKESAYEQCSDKPFYFYDHLMVYDIRNAASHPKQWCGPLKVIADSDNKIPYYKMLKNLFTVYFSQCLKYKDKIDECYNKAYEQEINFVQYSMNQRAKDREEEFESTYVKIAWQELTDGSGNDLQMPDFSKKDIPAYKLTGEAGAGKTTRMRKLYWDITDRVVGEEKLQILPIWFELKNWNKDQKKEFPVEGLLKEKIKEALGEYTQYYDKLIQQGQICIFLDGFNEVYLEDFVWKERLAEDIDNFHDKHTNIFIAMTDRLHRPNYFCLTQNNVKIFEFHGLGFPEDCKRYLEKTAGNLQEAIQYFDSQKAAWMAEDGIEITPEMLNNLIALIKQGKEPEDQQEFYECYMIHILNREWEDKRDHRIRPMMNLLRTLAKYFLEEGIDRCSEGEIEMLWTEKCGIDVEKAVNYFELFRGMPFIENFENGELEYGFLKPAYMAKALKF
ncbi:MAG: hypothetical protein IJ716_05980 [Lachnospiraceae bacterium]|nr:hypothetical protein [Lachnospiraceae bacterium]